jgi:hypothetical protein
MTIKEIRDLFLAQYDIQSQVRGTPQIKIVDKMLASFISQAQQDIQRRLLVVESYKDITLSTTGYLHSLPTNFGQHKHAYSGNMLLDEKPEQFIREQLAIGNSGYWFGIYPQGNTTQLITPLTSGTLTLFYYPDLRYYQPSVSSSQDWGTFSGTVYSGKLILPDRYDMAILYYMMAQVIPDYWNLYEKEVRSLKGSRLSSMDSAFGYELGGVNESSYSQDVLTSTSSTTTTAVPTDAADKKIRFRVSDGGGSATVEYEGGWTTTPTIVNNITTVVVTSADSEFTNWVHAESNNEVFGWAQTGSNIITFTPYPATGWGSVEFIIEVWN